MDNIKKYNIDYGYTTLLAFILNLRYNDSNMILISSLKKYPRYLVNLININLLNTGVNITMLTDSDEFEKYIKSNSDIFTTDGKYVFLNGNISLNGLYNLLYTNYDYSFTDLAIYTIQSSKIIKNILHLTGLGKTLDKINKNEKMIESIYVNNLFYRLQLTPFYKLRDDYYKNIIKLGSSKVRDIDEESLFILSDPYIKSFPIDSKNKYEIFPKDGKREIFNILLNPYLVAYFTDEALSQHRTNEDLNNIVLKHDCYGTYTNEREYIENIEIDAASKGTYSFRSKIETLFFLSLVKQIEKFKENASDEIKKSLKITQNRILYLLDNSTFNLSNKDSFNKLYNDLTNEYHSKKAFGNDFFEDMSFEIINMFGKLAKTFIFDLFEGIYDEELNMKKLAFIKTYYDITNDREIIMLFNRYSDNINFWNYNNYIKKNELKLIKIYND